MRAAVCSCFVRLNACRVGGIALGLGTLALASCSNDRPPPVRTVSPADASPPNDVADAPPPKLAEVSPHRAPLGHGAELYLPTWFAAHGASYDLIVHFHGEKKLQETNLAQCPINAAVVTVNLGVGTDRYGSAFRDPQAFQNLLADAHSEILRSGRAPQATLGRIALSAWSAGFVSVAKIMSQASNTERVDAVLLADGFFTRFANPKKRTISPASLERFVAFAGSARRGEKLFALTHSSIPTADYPSVEETVGKLLELTAMAKTTSQGVGPREMRETYVVDEGAFHVKGYRGTTAGDHVKQIRAMGNTLFPYLRTRWDVASAATGASSR